jgi:hypothetical protein
MSVAFQSTAARGARVPGNVDDPAARLTPVFLVYFQSIHFTAEIGTPTREIGSGVNHGNLSRFIDLGHISMFSGGRFPVCFCHSGDAGHKKFK